MTNVKIQMTKECQKPKTPKYDLEERTSKFGENIIEFAKTIPKNETTRPLISQIVRSGTSVGANYMEADVAESKKDFRYRISICKREAKETCHWLRMISKAIPNCEEDARKLWKEGRELVLIFFSINNKTKK